MRRRSHRHLPSLCWLVIIDAVKLKAPAVALLLVVVLSGCNKKESDTKENSKKGSITETSGCKLFTKSDAETLLDGAVGKGTVDDSGKKGDKVRTSCRYTRDDLPPGDLNATAQFLINRDPEQTPDLKAGVRQLKEDAFANADTEDVSNLGDAAVWAEHGSVSELAIFLREDFIIFTVGSDIGQDDVVATAKKTLSRLEV